MISIQTKEDKAYKDLRALILEGKLPVGEFLSQRRLAEQVGAAVVTVRGALRQLEKDGLMESQPKWGFRIIEETEDRIRDRYFVRELMEVGAVERIIEKHDPQQAQRLLDLARQCDEVSPHGPEPNVDEFAQRHSLLHLTMAEFSGCPLLVETLVRLNLRTRMLYNATRGWARGRDRSPRHHQELIEAILTYDHDQAVEAMRQHVRSGLQYELEAIGEDVHVEVIWKASVAWSTASRSIPMVVTMRSAWRCSKQTCLHVLRDYFKGERITW